MIYITGDKHGDFSEVYGFCCKNKTTRDDLMIVLGDAGINYHASEKDIYLKDSLLQYPITFFCIHGNHEERPENITSYKTKIFHGGIVYYEEEYPHLLFAKDGEIYQFNHQSVLVIGGAYSVDKNYRLQMGYNWYPSEQPSDEIKEKLLLYAENHPQIDVVLSHTCPYKYLPREVFMTGINPLKVDYSTEFFLDKLEIHLDYKKWYCGHFHTDKVKDKMRFMFDDIIEF